MSARVSGRDGIAQVEVRAQIPLGTCLRHHNLQRGQRRSMFFLTNIGVRQQETPFWYGLLHVGTLGAIELIMRVGEPGTTDVIAELHPVGADGIEIGAVRYA